MKKAVAVEPGSLASNTSTRSRIRAGPDHPQLTAKFAENLEAWFDAGLTLQSKIGDQSGGLKGTLLLPRGYSGFTDESPLLEALLPRITVWPVRLDVGDVDVDTAVPRTLYHFTNRSVFQKLARECIEEQQAELEHHAHHEAISLAYRFVLEDCRERDPERDEGHDHSADIELCTVEPNLFQSREDVLRTTLGELPVVPRTSSHGHTIHSFADCCVAVRVPGSACTPKKGSNDMVIVKYDTLHALHKRAAARRQVNQRREATEKNQIQQDQEQGDPTAIQDDKAPNKASGCLSILCGKNSPVVSYFPRRKKKKKQTDQSVDAEILDRPKRELDFYTRKLNRVWMKEHFVKMHKRVEFERQVEIEKQAKEASREERRNEKLEAEKRAAAMEGRFRFTIAGEEERLRKARKAKEEKERKAKEQALEEAMSDKKDNPALKAYEEWMRNNDEDKDMARAALVRIKLPRQVFQKDERQQRQEAQQVT